MDRRATLLRLTAELSSAGATADWERLGIAARLLGPQLSTLAAEGPWSAAERSALALLRAAHTEAMAACELALGALAARLDEMRANKDGWIAYALDAGLEAQTEPATHTA
jgi:hypothetical protein